MATDDTTTLVVTEQAATHSDARGPRVQWGLNRTDLPGGWLALWNLPINRQAIVTSTIPPGYCAIEKWSYQPVFGETGRIYLATKCDR